MTLLLLVLALVVLGVTVALIAGVLDGRMPPPDSSIPPVRLPDGPVDRESLVGIRFAPALRGYRMDQVDAVLDRAGDALAARDAEIARLREELRGSEVEGPRF